MPTLDTPSVRTTRCRNLFHLLAVSVAVCLSSSAIAQGTNPIPGDGPICRLAAPTVVSFNTVLQPSITVPLVADCTRYPVLWEWTAPPLDYTSRNLTGQNALFAPLFANSTMRWTYDNRKVTTTNTIPITFTATGTYTFATRAKDADYLPSGQPAGFWGPWGNPGFQNLDDAGAWQNIRLVCTPQSETRNGTPGGNLVCGGGQVSTVSETRTFCADSVTPTWGPWVPTLSCECPSGTTWNGTSCVPVPVCNVTPIPASGPPGTTVNWSVACNTAATTITWTPTDPPLTPIVACSTGSSCSQTYPEPDTICYAVQGSNGTGQGPRSTPACATIACPVGQSWSSTQRVCGVAPTITSPVFNVGTPAPATIPVTVTGTPTLTCSALNLPAGFVMSTACVLSAVTPGTPIPNVPASCTVTVTNPWGTDTKPCIEFTVPLASCEARWASFPLNLNASLTDYGRLHPSTDYYERLTTLDPPIRGREFQYGRTGAETLVVSTRNAASYTVSCNGSPSITQSPLSIGNGLGSARVQYTEINNVPPIPVYDVPVPLSGVWYSNPPDGNGNSTGGFWFYGPYRFSHPGYSALPAPSTAMCSVEVRDSLGRTSTCAAPTIDVVNSQNRAVCSLDVRGELLKYRNGLVTEDLPPTFQAGSSTYDTSGYDWDANLDAVNKPNAKIRLSYSLRAQNIQLIGSSYMTPGSGESAAFWEFDTTQTPTDRNLQCRVLRRAPQTPNPTWQPRIVELLSGSSQAFNPSDNTDWYESNMDRNNLRQLYSFSTPWGSMPRYDESLWEPMDSLNEELDVECSYTGSGFNSKTGARETVTCGGWYQYRPGAVCSPNVTFVTGPSGIQYSNGASYTGYLASWRGTVRFAGERVVLTETGGNDLLDSPFPTAAGGQVSSKPRLNQFLNSFNPNSPALLFGVSQSAFGSTIMRSLYERVAATYPNLTDENLGVAGSVIATQSRGGTGLSDTPWMYDACAGRGFGNGYTACQQTARFAVERIMFPGTAAERLSKTSCSIETGSNGTNSGGPGGTPSGPGSTFGPGNTGSTTGGTGSGGSTGGNGNG